MYPLVKFYFDPLNLFGVPRPASVNEWGKWTSPHRKKKLSLSVLYNAGSTNPSASIPSNVISHFHVEL